MYKLLFSLLFISNIALAQRNCTSDEYNKQLKENNIEFYEKQQQLEQYTSDYINLLPLMNTSTSVHTIPVVIHILYNNATENISNAQIQSQLDSLNNDFRALNSDISNVPDVFAPLIADVGIEFCLATQDPEGNESTGINRVFTVNSSFSPNFNNMKYSSQGGVDVWDSKRYLNIWVCDLSGGTLGFAQFPGGPEATDGVVIDYEYFGSIGTASYPYELGKTLTHEIGHWLNLRHIWGDSYCGDDFVDDTPTHESSNGGCPTFPSVSCNNGPNGDMFMNYMDYTYDNCLHMFTTGQKNRMIAALNSNRSELLNNNLCSPYLAGCTDSTANNYNSLATASDSSCQYNCTDYEFNITTDCWANETSWQLSKGEEIILAIEGDYENTTSYSYDFCLTEGCYTLTISDSYGDGVSGAAYSDCNSNGDYSLSSNNIPIVTMAAANFGSSISHDFCVEILSGCTDSEAINYDNNAQIDDGSCEYSQPTACDEAPSGLNVDNIIHNRVKFNWQLPNLLPSHYMIRYRAIGTTSWNVITAGPTNYFPYSGTSRNRYFMEPNTSYEWSIRSRLLNEDGSINCQSPWSANSEFTTLAACANLVNLSASTEANWVALSAYAPDASWEVWQSKAKMRVVGTNAFRYANGDNNGNISVLKGNFTPSTNYEWHTKAWCRANVDDNNNPDPQYHSGWGEFSSFTTEALCNKIPSNLTTSANGAQTAITMSWDTPESGEPDHYFLQLTNVTTEQVWEWNNLSGSSNSKTKFGLTAGDYSWRIRGACGTNGTSWATSYTNPVFYNLGGLRLENKSNSINVFPNPSNHLFNIKFSTLSEKEIELSVFNSMGQIVLTKTIPNTDNKTSIDLEDQSNGIYNLRLRVADEIINQVLIKQ